MNKISKYASFSAIVVRETKMGCILSLDLGDGEYAPAYTYGGFSVGDTVWVTILKSFADDRYPVACVDTVLNYASESAA